MSSITFFDTEVEPNSGKILDIGGINVEGNRFHSSSILEFKNFLTGSQFLCGHNILNHDLKYIKNIVDNLGFTHSNFIDTLFLSPLMFPTKPYHALLKDDKLQTEELNNPLNDSMKACDLFFDEVSAFENSDNIMQQIFYLLLKDKKEFCSFFHFLEARGRFSCFVNDSLDITHFDENLENLIKTKFHSQICEKADIDNIIFKYPIELAYCLALINSKCRYSITPPWVTKNFPAIERVMRLLRNKPCLNGCIYCNEVLDIHKGLKHFFGFDSYRTYSGENLQEKAVQAAVNNKSLLAVFPTGGGKSITFQVPALMSGLNSMGLTVVISPLQSLMKDQIDNLEKLSITDAVTINGLLDPIERANSFERVENGSASILYISPESLRSRSMEHLLLGRNIVRFVIDEAHCISSWGQDFRVDYLYIGDFIKSIQQKKNLEETIPVSCFTATAKPKVIEDICYYFKEKLDIDMEIFTSGASRSNLHYKVLEKDTEEDKYNTLRNLIDEKNCPTIVYVSRTSKSYKLAERLSQDGYISKPYHGKMDKQEKSENQDKFINGDVQIMVATSAFGMGVDKKDVGMVVHYEISDSLENYIQEAGRAGRDEAISADCYILFNDEDLNKHFILLNQTKLSIKEIGQIWKAIKYITKFRSQVSQSALEIAQQAGWDDSVVQIETRVKTAIYALETAGYLKRGQNMPRIFANSILAKNAQEAIHKVNISKKFDKKQKENATRIIKKLFSSKSTKHKEDDEAESRVDYISYYLGIVKEDVIQIVNLLREENILADQKDLTAYIKKNENTNRSLKILKMFWEVEKFLITVLEEQEKTFNLKKLYEQAQEYGCSEVTPKIIKTVFNFLAIKNCIKRQVLENSKNHIVVLSLCERAQLEANIEKRYDIARFILEYLFDKYTKNKLNEEQPKDEFLVEFSIFELKESFENIITIFNTKVTPEDIEDALFYLSKINALKIEGGFMVIYNPLTIMRIEEDNKKRYTAEDYQKLKQFYQNRVNQIHIVGEYARKMLDDYKDALQFVDDYFQLNYNSFLNKYFKGSRQEEIKRSITPAKFKQLFGELSPTQLKIINDIQSQYIVVAAGPGSGKTRILVHKLASLMLMEDIKHEQLLMLTFSRSAVTEFKKRLQKLIGNAANYIEIKTFHSYCFELLGRVGTIAKSGDIIQETIQKIRNEEVEVGKITKTVLVIDEAQDMDENEFELINTLMIQNEEMRVIAVGDDDQNIYEFRGSSSKYMKNFHIDKKAVLYELVENFRSKCNLVDFTNQFVERIPNRLKNTPIISVQSYNGQIKLVRYTSSNLITPLVNDILLQGISGTTCILTKTNEEAFQITSLLINNGISAKLIQSNDGFHIRDLLEVRFFLSQLPLLEGTYTICEDIWQNAKRKLKEKFASSLNLEITQNIIKDFESVNPKCMYKSDMDIFLYESKLEDFFGENVETIFVSTIHKSKGREFDNVFLMLDSFNPKSDEDKRLLYVALTRAKSNLTIHYNGNYLDNIKTEALTNLENLEIYDEPSQLSIQLTLKDVWLDYFISRQNLISQLSSGDLLTIVGDWCCNSKGQPVLKFSQKFSRDQIEKLHKKNYSLKKAKIRFILFYHKKDSEDEFLVILPELYFERSQGSV